ncbi:hypothetical protein X805_17860 [Sphaerotilus natans subsp. natans DSM 6575]|uniref:Uncharacterized protein n=1 Tax=Sphaerotilus natans subsp. natans DSM 6575 TaxID=1286631 RepID=A0A059KMA1_9BURK|nr:hypothetical protein X805_17860 [Sphaerotilus natans subsp. natans DSM 6575]
MARAPVHGSRAALCSGLRFFHLRMITINPGVRRRRAETRPRPAVRGVPRMSRFARQRDLPRCPA